MFGFGKKVEIEIPDGNGGTKKVKVPQKTFDQWVREGRIQRVETCTVHITDPIKGVYETQWRIGSEISRETYEKFKDGSGDIYVQAHYEAGKPVLHVSKPQLWHRVVDALAAMDRGDSGPMEKLQADIRNGSV